MARTAVSRAIIQQGYLRTEFIIASMSVVPKAVLTAASIPFESRRMSPIRPPLLSRSSIYRDTEFLTSSMGVIVRSNSLPVAAPISSGTDRCPSGRTLLLNLYVFLSFFMYIILRYPILLSRDIRRFPVFCERVNKIGNGYFHFFVFLDMFFSQRFKNSVFIYCFNCFCHSFFSFYS